MNQANYTALSVYFTKYYGLLVRYCMKYVNSREDAEDIVQDCFVKLWEKKYLINEVSVGAFLFTMARNACYNALKHKAIVSDFAAWCFQQNKYSDSVFEYDFLGVVNDRGLVTDLMIYIRSEVDKLPERCREVFKMSRYEGLSNKEIAEKLGISEPAVHKHIDKAVAKLKSKIR